MNSTRLRLLVAALPAVLLLGGCGGGFGGSSDSAGPGGAEVTEPVQSDPGTASDKDTTSSRQKGARAGSSKSGTNARPAVGPMSRAVISTGQVRLEAKRLARTRAEVLRLAASWGATVADEQTESDRRGRIVSSTLTLRVPVDQFDDAMQQLGGLGKVQQESRKSEDVTTEVIDNQARVRAAERSIRQLERLLDRASDLSDILAIEADLARRQADLDSLKSQQAWLEDQTSLSTINVYLDRSSAAPRAPEDQKGFLAGLADGWAALQAATVTVLTVLGALLPFAALGLLAGVPLWWVVRRRRPAV